MQTIVDVSLSTSPVPEIFSISIYTRLCRTTLTDIVGYRTKIIPFDGCVERVEALLLAISRHDIDVYVSCFTLCLAVVWLFLANTVLRQLTIKLEHQHNMEMAFECLEQG